MSTTISFTDTFSCTLERAFKAPIYGDATRFFTGYRFQPAVTGFEEDETWGEVGGYRYPSTDGNLFLKPGITFYDVILQKIPNEYWEWAIYDFKSPFLFFLKKCVGSWEVEEIRPGLIDVCFTYQLVPVHRVLHPICWVFVQVQWRGMIKRAFVRIKAQAESEEILFYDLKRASKE
ncbi:MAG: hypothetical protein AAGC85_18085 [Bacteroidota bacterium]